MYGGTKKPSSTRRNQRIKKAPNTATGVLSSTLKGSDQLSYSAARIKKNKEKRNAKNHGGGNTFSCFLLLKRYAGIVETHLARHGLLENILKCGRSLARAVTRTRRAIELRAAVFVEAHRKFRAGARLDSDQRGKRDILALIITDVELSDVFHFGASLALGFDVHLPLAAK